MNIKKILSSALALVMVFTALLVLVPAVNVSAAHSSSVGSSKYTAEQVKKIVEASYKYDFANAEEMLEYELGEGYLDYVISEGGEYTMYVNRYTGMFYYVNNTTGQVLTSNPYNPYYNSGFVSESLRRTLMSQITVEFSSATSSDSTVYDSSQWAAEYAQIKVTRIANGLRVNYTLGDTSTRFLLPGQITAEKFESLILTPMFEKYAELLEEYCGEALPDYNFSIFNNEKYDLIVDGCFSNVVVTKYLTDTQKEQQKVTANNSPERKTLDNMRNYIFSFFRAYRLYNPNSSTATSSDIADMNEKCELTKDGIAIYSCTANTVTLKRRYSAYLRNYAPDYTFQDMYADEKECGYVSDNEIKPAFRCALEYTFNSDGSFSVRLPANSISFDETLYILKSITPLSYFGAGDLTGDGYIFLPDGSGSVVEFNDFYSNTQKENVYLNLSMYGQDFCYSNISGAHREQVTMPVYGIVSEYGAGSTMQSLTGSKKYTGGYFAIMEQGASLASVIAEFGGMTNKYAYVHSSFSPYPSDQYDLSDTISVGAAGSYTIVSESKYTGSYVTRYVMLTDEVTGFATGGDYISASYVGMATYYREYLKAQGVLTALLEVNEKLPLYIEALGSMEIVEKFLTFPVNTSIALTTFDDVVTMYEELSSAKEKFLEKANEYYALAEAETNDMALKEKYFNTADSYKELSESEEIFDLTNINFRLTGFANGGMNYTYPARVKWERVCGGKDGVELILAATKKYTKDGNSFEIFPEFDFMYVSNTALFDGVSIRNTVSRMVDNRYASKQLYDSVLGEFVSYFTMVVSSDAIDELYTKFQKKYSTFGIHNISVSTMGSDVNSNFGEDNPINRDEAVENIISVLDRMANENNYGVMISKGNSYALKYADHIVDINIDSSHFTYSSYTVPFTGLVLHGYVNYAGSAFNYSGSPDYDLLRAIENGASLYYILCYRNTGYMKDDEALSKYYGVDYTTWYDSIVESYSELNYLIGEYQKYEIVDHKVLVGERVIDADEVIANREAIMDEFLSVLDATVAERVNDAFDAMYGDSANDGRGVKVTLDTDALLAIAYDKLNVNAETEGIAEFAEKLVAIKTKYETLYAGGTDSYLVEVDAIDYTSRYDYVTDSSALDENYDKTDYTIDNSLITMVTYRDSVTGHTVDFILNYNIYSVSVRLDDDSKPIEIGAYGYHKNEH